MAVLQEIRITLCSQVLLSKLGHHETFTGNEREDREGLEGGEGGLITLDVAIEQLEFKDCISHPRLHVQSVERKRNSRHLSQDRKCLFPCCL